MGKETSEVLIQPVPPTPLKAKKPIPLPCFSGEWYRVLHMHGKGTSEVSIQNVPPMPLKTKKPISLPCFSGEWNFKNIILQYV